MKSRSLPTIGLAAVFSAASILSAKAGEKDEVIIRELAAAQKAAFDPGGPASVIDSKVDGLLRELDPSAYELAARTLIPPGEKDFRHDTYSLVMKWVVADPKESFNFMSTHCPAILCGNVADALFKEWSYRNPRQAFEAARTALPEGNRPGLVSIVLQVMAVKSPREAILEIDRNDSRFATVVGDILVYWVSVNPAEATHWALAENHHQQLVWDASYSWSSFDRDAAAQWAETLNQEDRTMSWTGILTQQAANSRHQAGRPDKAADKFFKLFPNPALDQENYSNQAVTELAEYIVRSWSTLDGAQRNVMDWIMKLPDLPRRRYMVSELLSGWAKLNLDQMEAYTETLAEGAIKDEARQKIVTQFATKNPSKGFEKAKLITDEDLRTGAMDVLFFQWLRSNPNQADAALAALPKQQQDQILKKVREIGGSARMSRIPD